MNVQDWFTAHISIITDVSTAVFSVEIATREATRIATQQRSLTSAPTKAAFRKLTEEARSARAVVDRALALEPIPDIDTNVQFRHTMELQAAWADTMAAAAAEISPDKLDRATQLQLEAARQSTVLTEEIRKAWPDYDPGDGEA